MKLNILKEKLFWKAFALDLLFMFLFIFVTKFFISKIYGIIVIMQGIGALLGNYEDLSQDTINFGQANELNNLVMQLGNNLNQLIFNFVSYGLIILLFYTIIKSLEWNLIYHGKLVNYKNYLKRFLVLTLILSLFLIPLSYYILIKSRIFLIDYLFFDNLLIEGLIQVIFIFLVMIFIIYLVFCGYFYINNFKLSDSIKKIFKFNKFWLYLILILAYLISLFIVRYGLILNTSIYSMIFLSILVSFIFLSYKFYLTYNLK